MRVVSLFSLMAAMVAAAPAAAQTKDIQIAPEPSWVNKSELMSVPADASGLAFVRRNDILVHLNENGQSTYSGQRMKLLDARALEVGNLALSWNPSAGTPQVHRLLIHRNGNATDVLKDNAFEILRREDQLEQDMLTGYLTAVLRVPDLRVGDELEWSYTVPTHDPIMKDESFGLATFGIAPLTGKHKIGLSWTEGQEPKIQMTDDFTGLARRTANAISVTLKNPEMLSVPKDAPPRYSWQRIIEYSDFATWPDISKRFNSLFTDASKLSPESKIKKEAGLIAQAHSDKFEQMKAALALVQDQVRYIYVGLNGGNYKPATAEDTWQRRYGDCKGKSVLLLALLKELDIEAEFVLVSNSGADDGFDMRLPSPALFDHILVRAKHNNIEYWLDPTLPSVIEPNQRSIIPYRFFLPLSGFGSILEPVRQKPFELPQEMGVVEIDARAGFDKPARRVQTSIQRGLEGFAEYMNYSALTAEQLKTAFRSAYAGSSQWDSIDYVSYKYDRDTQASILSVTGTGPVDWDENSEGRYSLSLPGGGFRPPSRRQRVNEESGDIPYYSALDYSCHTTTVRLPDNTDLKKWGFNTTFETRIFGRRYYRMIEKRDDRTIRMVRSSRVEYPEISIERAELDNARIDDFDNSKAVIKYNPKKEMKPWGNLRPVPATYEINWSGADTPCLPGSGSNVDLPDLAIRDLLNDVDF